MGEKRFVEVIKLFRLSGRRGAKPWGLGERGLKRRAGRVPQGEAGKGVDRRVEEGGENHEENVIFLEEE